MSEGGAEEVGSCAPRASRMPSSRMRRETRSWPLEIPVIASIMASAPRTPSATVAARAGR